MTINEFMHYAFVVWLLMAISFAFFLLGLFIGHKVGWNGAKALYKGSWNDH